MTTSTEKIGFMTTDVPLVVVDADAIVAQAILGDALHAKAVAIAQKLVDLRAQVLYPVTAITEATTYMQRVLNSRATAYETAVTFTDPAIRVVQINKKTIQQAVNFFSSSASKKNTLYDCIVAAVAEEHQADAIFSFDKFYKTKGFTLASDL